jgi:hypothetical protein
MQTECGAEYVGSYFQQTPSTFDISVKYCLRDESNPEIYKKSFKNINIQQLTDNIRGLIRYLLVASILRYGNICSIYAR